MELILGVLPGLLVGLIGTVTLLLMLSRGPSPWSITNDIIRSKELSDEDAVRWLLRYYRTLDYPGRGSLLEMLGRDAVEYLTRHRPRTIPGVPQWDRDREAAVMRRRIRRARQVDLVHTVLTAGAETRAARRRWLRSPDQAAAWHEVEAYLDAPEPSPKPEWLTEIFKAAVADRREDRR